MSDYSDAIDALETQRLRGAAQAEAALAEARAEVSRSHAAILALTGEVARLGARIKQLDYPYQVGYKEGDAHGREDAEAERDEARVEIARLRAVVSACGLDPSRPIPGGLTMPEMRSEMERLREGVAACERTILRLTSDVQMWADSRSLVESTLAHVQRERDEARAVARDHHLHACESCAVTESDLIAARAEITAMKKHHDEARAALIRELAAMERARDARRQLYSFELGRAAAFERERDEARAEVERLRETLKVYAQYRDPLCNLARTTLATEVK